DPEALTSVEGASATWEMPLRPRGSAPNPGVPFLHNSSTGSFFTSSNRCEVHGQLLSIRELPNETRDRGEHPVLSVRTDPARATPAPTVQAATVRTKTAADIGAPEGG